jgi:OOP family OmpA-OmpF porin
MPEMTAETPETTEPIVAAPVQRQAAADCQPLIDRAMNANTVMFESTSARLTATGQKRLDGIAKLGVGCGTLRFHITGHSDRTPAETGIEYLSQDRALAVAQYLQGKGIGADRIKASAMRASMPVNDADTPEAHGRNRRAEVSILP